MKLAEEAFGLKGAPRTLPAGATLESEAVEQLLHGLAQKGLSEQIGVSLLEQLRAAKAVDSKVYAAAVQRFIAVPKGADPKPQDLHQHRHQQQDRPSNELPRMRLGSAVLHNGP